MAKEKESAGDGSAESAIKHVDTPAPMTMEQLFKMNLDLQRENIEANKKLAEALLESRKPYVDPKVVAQRIRDGEERRKQIEAEQRAKVLTKQLCPHLRDNGTSNIQWMEHSNHIVLGVCGTCNSQFDARNPDDLKLLRSNLKAIKNMGRAGAHAQRGMLV